MSVEQFTGQAATQFVIAQEKIGLLLGTGGKTFKRIGSLFKVHIHLTSGHHQSGEWVSIYGKEDDRARAKEYIMSMCNPIVEEKIPYSEDLHEHLVGKGGKTHRYLESNSSAVITFSTACTGPNEHTAHIRGSKESVTHATNLVKEIIRKTQKRRQKENQPPGNLKPEDLDKEILNVLKAENKLAFWENIKNENETYKRNYLAHYKSQKTPSAESSPSTSSEGGPEDGISSHAELLAYAKKLGLSEEDANKVLNQTGSAINKNGFLASLMQVQRENEQKAVLAEQSKIGASLLSAGGGAQHNVLPGDMFRSPYSQEFRSYPGLVSESCSNEFRLEQPSSAFDTLPIGMTARSLLQQQQRLDHSRLDPGRLDHVGGLSSHAEFASAPASSQLFTANRYEPSNTLSLEQLLNSAKLQQLQQPPSLQTPSLQTPSLQTPGQLHSQLSTGSLPPPPQQQAQVAHQQAAQQQESDLLIQLLLKEKDDRQQQQQAQQQRELELLLRHQQQQQYAEQIRLQQQQKRVEDLKQQRYEDLKQQLLYKTRLEQQHQHVQQQNLFSQQPQAGSSQIGAALNQNLAAHLNSLPPSSLTNSLRSQQSITPLSPASQQSYDLFSNTANVDLYRNNSIESKLNFDFLRESDTSSANDVVDLFSHLNL